MKSNDICLIWGHGGVRCNVTKIYVWMCVNDNSSEIAEAQRQSTTTTGKVKTETAVAFTLIYCFK